MSKSNFLKFCLRRTKHSHTCKCLLYGSTFRIAHIVFSFDSGWLTVHTLSCLSCRYRIYSVLSYHAQLWSLTLFFPFPLRSQTPLFPFHQGVLLCCFLSTLESVSIVSFSPQSWTPLFPFHQGVWLCCFLPLWSLTPLFTSTAESDSVVSFHPIVRLCWFLSTTESYSVVSFPLQSHTTVFPFHCRVGLCCFLPLCSLTPLFPSAMESDSVVSFHCGVWLCSVLPNGEESDSDIQMQISRQKQI